MSLYVNHALWKMSDDHLPAAMTGSFISSLVIGHRNSSGMPEHTDSLFSSSTFLRSLLRRPMDSTDTNIRTHKQEWNARGEKRLCNRNHWASSRTSWTDQNTNINNNINIKILSICYLALFTLGWQMWAWVRVNIVGAEHVCWLSVHFKVKY